ncbi:hypothetical protein ERJ75_000773400 [Trypanosoma vivax]|uniref:Uncharacterized protein n=1 Tax=Trypanosoma vivax (strain Y486) TaxID=1055687 RepID=G0U3J8_TRYVY|nr:hypothetical protein TRVL_02754 [Trypanosoma vivax]KAH8614294.1 hypothetical protein ERJ75_000773400 [Trypanosoma vivax]CCC50855.1 conserved hypothetical protein [Trypanosoma vivax Y486]
MWRLSCPLVLPGIISHKPAALILHRRTFFIPPQLARLIAATAVIALKAFITAHRREVKRLNEQEILADSRRLRLKVMPPTEALQVLGMDTRLSVPLRSEDDRRLATGRFKHLFGIASKCDNAYLQGKVSAAYRLCVDADWDAGDSDDSSGANSK